MRRTSDLALGGVSKRQSQRHSAMSELDCLNRVKLVGAEGFVPIPYFLKRYALFSLEPKPNISYSVNN